MLYWQSAYAEPWYSTTQNINTIHSPALSKVINNINEKLPVEVDPWKEPIHPNNKY